MGNWFRTLTGFILVMLLAVGSVSAQSGRGTISGVVIDPSGGVVPLAAITATNQDTGVVTSTRTNDQGLYSLLNLPVGTYTIEFSLEGFTPFVQRGVRVGVASALTLDAALTVGGLTDAVTVTADAPILESRNAELGTALKNTVVTNLPLSMTGGRQLENFAYAITPSVEGNNWESNIAGGAPFSKEVILDGTSAVIQIQGHISESSPPMEAVEEFKVQTSGIPAEYGRTGGGVFNFSLRSGTNEMRGSAYGQFRHEALNANTWMNNYLAAVNPSQADRYEKARDRQKLGGTSVGGPVFKNRTFYFASFEEYQQTRMQLGNFDRTVPVPQFLSGDFSQLLDRNVILGYDKGGSPIYKGAIFDPQTGLVFPGNVIPASRISPISQRITDIYRQSYQPMIPGRLMNNSAATAYNDPDFKQHQFSVKADHNLTANGRLTGSLIWTKRPRTLADQGGVWDPSDSMGGPLSKARRQEVGTWQARVSHSQVLSPTLLHVASATYSRFNNPSTSGSSGGDWPSALGINAAGGAHGTFPQINYGSSINGIGMTPIGYGISNFYVANVYQFNDSLSWVKGRHVFKFGGEARFMQMNSHGDRNFLEFNFGNDQTGLRGQPWSNQVGFGFASFLLGEVASASQRVQSDLYGRRNYVALFAQDDFRVNDRLTMNLGLRWETTGGWREKHGRWGNFNIYETNPVTGRLGVLQFADEVDGSFEGDREWTEFGPRIGGAYKLTDRAVFRSAYGFFYAPIGVNYWGGVPYSFAPGFFGTNEVRATGDGRPAFNWNNGYPGQEVPAVKNPADNRWGLVSINPNALQAGRVQQWNAGVDYELTRDLVVGVNYLGNKGSKLQSGDFERNQPDPAAMKALMMAGKEWNWVWDAASAGAAGVPYPYAGFEGSAWMALTPYPQAAAGWGPLFFVGSPLGSSDYHALQLTADKRMAHGVAAAASYTLSRQRGNMDSGFQERWYVGPIQDVTKLDMEARVIGDNDRTHIAKGYVAWSLPIGSGRRFLGNATGLLNHVVGGWTVSTIFRYESGLPLRVTSSNSYAGWHYPIYVNRNPNVSLDRQFNGSNFNPGNLADPGNTYFDKAAFSNPAYGDLGEGPGRFEQLRGFGGAYEDLGIVKDFRVGRYTAQLKFELINVLNRHYFGNPELNMASPYFGQVTGMGWQSPRQGQLGLRFQW
jgi:hypothetical protein